MILPVKWPLTTANITATFSLLMIAKCFFKNAFVIRVAVVAEDAVEDVAEDVVEDVASYYLVTFVVVAVVAVVVVVNSNSNSNSNGCCQ